MHLLPYILVSALVSGFPASTQIYGPPAPVPTTVPGIKPVTTGWEVDRIRSEIREGRDRGQLSRRQSKELRREAGEVDGLANRYARDGLSDPERAELRSRVEVLRALTNAKRLGTIK